MQKQHQQWRTSPICRRQSFLWAPYFSESQRLHRDPSWEKWRRSPCWWLRHQPHQWKDTWCQSHIPQHTRRPADKTTYSTIILLLQLLLRTLLQLLPTNVCGNGTKTTWSRWCWKTSVSDPTSIFSIENLLVRISKNIYWRIMEVMRFFSSHNFFLVLLKITQYVFTVRTLLRTPITETSWGNDCLLSLEQRGGEEFFFFRLLQFSKA